MNRITKWLRVNGLDDTATPTGWNICRGGKILCFVSKEDFGEEPTIAKVQRIIQEKLGFQVDFIYNPNL